MPASRRNVPGATRRTSATSSNMPTSRIADRRDPGATSAPPALCRSRTVSKAAAFGVKSRIMSPGASACRAGVSVPEGELVAKVREILAEQAERPEKGGLTAMPLIHLPAFAGDLLADFERRNTLRVDTPGHPAAEPFLDMAGEDLRRAHFMTERRDRRSLCLAPDSSPFPSLLPYRDGNRHAAALRPIWARCSAAPRRIE